MIIDSSRGSGSASPAKRSLLIFLSDMSSPHQPAAHPPFSTDCWLDTHAGDCEKEKLMRLPWPFLSRASFSALAAEEVVGSYASPRGCSRTVMNFSMNPWMAIWMLL